MPNYENLKKETMVNGSNSAVKQVLNVKVR
jgi:hypothetical protein